MGPIRDIDSPRAGRWVLVVCCFLLGAFFIIAPSLSAKRNAQNEHDVPIIGLIICGLGLIALGWAIYREFHKTTYEWVDQAAERRAQQWIKAGRALPIPSTPVMDNTENIQHLQFVRAMVVEMAAIPWGKGTPPVSPEEARKLFDDTVGFVRSVTGDWSQFQTPVANFARMQAPWCYIGAAEVMGRLAYIRGGVSQPIGLRQGLRFIAEAQNVDPDNVDALITRARLFSGYPDKHWLRAAEDTLRRIQQMAPNHPRLPDAEAVLFKQFGEYDKALVANAEAEKRAPTLEEKQSARIAHADILLSLRRYEEAIAEYEIILREHENPWTWHNRSIALKVLGRNEEALASSDRALALMEFGAAQEINAELRKKLGIH